MNNLIAENLKATIGQAQRYTLVALWSAVIFVVLTLPNPSSGNMINWQLLGVPLSIPPPLALIALYFVYIGSCILADNMLIHVGDLVDKLGDIEQARAVLSYPTILTVSPLGRFFGAVLPAVLVIFGLAKIHVQGVYQLHPVVWWFAYGLSLMGVVVYARVQRFVVPNLYPERRRKQTTAEHHTGANPESIRGAQRRPDGGG
jgi:hypothetical protein